MQIELKTKEGSSLGLVLLEEESYRYRALMGEDLMILSFHRPEYLEIPLGSYVEWQGERYHLERPEAVTMHHSRHFEYKLELSSPRERSKRFKLRNPVDGRLRFPLTATPREHLELFVWNMNQRDPEGGWEVGDCLEAREQLVAYDHAFLYEALGLMAEAFHTEFLIEGKRVSLGKVERDKADPLRLSYGKNRGFLGGVGRSSFGDTPPIGRLYVVGGERNISLPSYGAKLLHLPKGGSLRYDGTHFEGEEGFLEGRAVEYRADAEGSYLYVAGKEEENLAEDSLDLSEIYPKRVGKVTEVLEVNREEHLYDFTDETIPEALDYEQYLIEGERMSLIFQTGQLAGREFGISYHHKAQRGKKGKRFEIVPLEEDGAAFPSEAFPLKAGDEYAVFHCRLPEDYINAYRAGAGKKEGAEWELMREAVRYLSERKEASYTFRGQLDPFWAKREWARVGGKLRLGSYIAFTDERMQPEPMLVRIVGIKEYLHEPHSPELELSNTTQRGSFATGLKKLASQEVLMERERKSLQRYSERRFQDSLQTIGQLEEAMQEGFNQPIKPVAVQSMLALFGDESLQFRFVNHPSTPREVRLDISFDKAAKQLRIAEGLLQHLTLGVREISPEHSPNETLFWRLPEHRSGRLDDPQQQYFLYARCPKGQGSGEIPEGRFELQEKPLPLEEAEGWNFLLGTLASESPTGERSFTRLYGFTEISPARITAPRIVSTDGNTYFDLEAGEIGGNLVFRSLDGRPKAVRDLEDDYLHRALRDGTTEIAGGLVLSNIIALKDSTGEVRAYLSGDPSQRKAFRAGVTNAFTNEERALVEINHDGSARLGQFHLKTDGEMFLSLSGEEERYMRFGKEREKVQDFLRENRIETPLRQYSASNTTSFWGDREDLHHSNSERYSMGYLDIERDGTEVFIENPSIIGRAWHRPSEEYQDREQNARAFASIMIGANSILFASSLLSTYEPNKPDYHNNGIVWWQDTGYKQLSEENRRATPKKIILNKGRHEVVLEVSLFDATYVEANDIRASVSLSTSWGAPDKREVAITDGGLLYYFGKDRYFALQREGEPFLSVRGSVDMPGVILSAQVNITKPEITRYYNSKLGADGLQIDKSFTRRLAQNTYQLRLRHPRFNEQTFYTLASLWEGHQFYIASQGKGYVDIQGVFERSGNYFGQDAAFQITAIGS